MLAYNKSQLSDDLQNKIQKALQTPNVEKSEQDHPPNSSFVKADLKIKPLSACIFYTNCSHKPLLINDMQTCPLNRKSLFDDNFECPLGYGFSEKINEVITISRATTKKG
jgi:hypothetical protein